MIRIGTNQVVYNIFIVLLKGVNITIEGSVVKINGSTSVTADNSSGSSCSASAINITPGVISINNPNQVDIN